MKFNESIIGPLVDPQVALVKNHPVANVEVGLNDAVFEKKCKEMGVSEYELNADRVMQTGKSVVRTQVPELDFGDIGEDFKLNISSESGPEGQQPNSDFNLDFTDFDR
ncbi:hypothetical protein [Vibrio splendidus]|uniref:hypothetical protein n=1 Tax=Vibrio splendidus TaxID=29497 RepID=UPI003D0A018D